jgi:hypothetical protein
MNGFIVFAVEHIIMPMMMSTDPPTETQRLPKRSDSAPTKGQTAARARRFARTNQIQRSGPPMSP